MPAGTGKPPFAAGTDDEVEVVVLDELVVVASSNPGSRGVLVERAGDLVGLQARRRHAHPGQRERGDERRRREGDDPVHERVAGALTRANTEPTRRRRTGISTRRYEISASTPVTITAATNCGNVSVLPATRRTIW